MEHAGLAAGSHVVRVVPTGCGRNKKVLKAKIDIV